MKVESKDQGKTREERNWDDLEISSLTDFRVLPSAEEMNWPNGFLTLLMSFGFTPSKVSEDPDNSDACDDRNWNLILLWTYFIHFLVLCIHHPIPIILSSISWKPHHHRHSLLKEKTFVRICQCIWYSVLQL